MVKLYILGILLYYSSIVDAKFCANNSDCNAESVCSNGLCICAPGKVPSGDGRSCLDITVGIGSECTEDIQCLSWIVGPSVCTKDGFCGCKPGYRYLNNTCTEISGYNEFCSFDYLCQDGINSNALKCDSGVCSCNNGYYLRGDFDCRLSGKETKKCFFDIDCESKNECCEFIYGPDGKCLSKNITNNCTNNFYHEKYDEIIYLDENTSVLNLNLPCDKNESCAEVLNSFCADFRKKCTCNEGFVYNQLSHSCIPALGSTCETNEDCPISFSFCNKNKICTCSDYFVNSNYNDKCFKPARDIGMSCARDENCYSLGTYAFCNNNKCDCNNSSKFDEALMLCRPTPDICNDNKCYNNCTTKPHSTCVDSKCICEEHYLDKDFRCLPDIGFECSYTDVDCLIENAHCFNNKCECLPGYIKEDNRKCREGIACVDNCQAKPHSFCDQHDRCICEENYLDEDNKCYPDLGYECNMEYNDCKIENAECINDKCDCIEGYEKEDKRKCRKGTEKKPCTTVIQIFMNNNFTVYYDPLKN